MLIDFLGNHTFRMVLFGTMTIGFVAGALGSFAYLRKQSLMSDVISHAALPGTLLAFLVMVVVFGVDGRNMIALIIGAVTVGTAASLFANWVANHTKIRIDTAMAVTLTMFFGAGMLLMRVVANGPYPGKGGIQDYLFGNASVITVADLTTSLVVGGIALIMMTLLWKEFAIRTFDAHHARMLGFSGSIIDALLFTTIVIAIVIGVKAVGLVLMVAFVVTPAAAARQWTTTLHGMVLLAGAIGAVGSGVGAFVSIAAGNVPTGPVIVLTLFVVFLASILLSPRRSILLRVVRQRTALAREVA